MTMFGKEDVKIYQVNSSLWIHRYADTSCVCDSRQCNISHERVSEFHVDGLYEER